MLSCGSCPSAEQTLSAKRPWSCDTFVALPDVTADGSMLLAKNSDRPARECQPLRYWPRRRSSAISSLRLAYLEIPDVRQSWAHLGGSPYWCWGHELGLNEWGVGIGNRSYQATPVPVDYVTNRTTGRSHEGQDVVERAGNASRS